MRYLQIFILLFAASNIPGQITTDGTVGSAAPGPVPRNGPAYTIGADLGLVSGSNLFHSFSQFNIHPPETATFTGPDSIANIIGRVTGGERSIINGKLVSAITNADLVLINPAGIVLGAQAEINVNGAFSVSTADYIKFDDGSLYNASLSSSNFTGTPTSLAAFGFLSTDPSSIKIDGGKILGDGELSVVGGDINIVNGKIESTGGTVNLISTKSEGEVVATKINGKDQFDTDDFDQLGKVSIVFDPNAPMPPGMMGGQQGGGQTGDMRRETIGPTAGIQVDGDVNGDIPAGEITILADRLEILNGASLFASSATGDAGTITIRANSILMDGQGSDSFTGISAQTIEPMGNMQGGGMTGQTMNGSIVSTAGNIEIHASSLEIFGGAEVNASTSTAVPAGKIELTATDSILIDSQEFNQRTGLISETRAETGGGKGGGIFITTGTLEVRDVSSFISATTFGDGDSGNVTVQANSIILDRLENPNITGGMQMVGFNGIVAETKLSKNGVMGGAGGIIDLQANRVELRHGSLINTNTHGNGLAGKILLSVQELELDAGSRIVSESLSMMAGGEAGSITINATNTVLLLDQSSIKTSSIDAGGGKITVNARELIYLISSEISTSAQGALEKNTAGDISIDPINVVLNNSSIIANAFGGNGGNIDIRANNFIQSNNSRIEASSALRNDGQVKVTSPDADVSAGLIALNTDFIDAADWIVARCSLRSSENISSFIRAGRGGVPFAPGDLQPGLIAVTLLDEVPSSAVDIDNLPVQRTLPFELKNYQRDSGPCFDCE